MFELTERCRFHVSAEAVSMGNGIRGLTNKVMSWTGMSPMSGDCFVFFSRDRKQVKILMTGLRLRMQVAYRYEYHLMP